jgi:hypothetical protein
MFVCATVREFVRRLRVHRVWLSAGKVRIISMGYATFLSTWTGHTKPLKERSEKMLKKLRLARVGAGRLLMSGAVSGICRALRHRRGPGHQ